MDPVIGAVIIAGLTTVGKPTAEVLTGIVSKIISPTGEALGQGIAAPLQVWAKRRGERAAGTLVEAASIVHAAKIEPQQVPSRLLMPILEHSSLEEDEGLHACWTALLANAASPGPTVLPAFAEILSQLTPIQAQMLDWIFRNSRVLTEEGRVVKHPLFVTVHHNKLLSQFPDIGDNFNLLATDLHRLRLIEGGQLPMGLSDVDGVVISTYNWLELTALGRAFVLAVNKPGADLGGISFATPIPEHLRRVSLEERRDHKRARLQQQKLDRLAKQKRSQEFKRKGIKKKKAKKHKGR